MICAAWIRGPEVGCIRLLFQRSDLLCRRGISPHPAMRCPTGRACASAGPSGGERSRGPYPSCGSGSQNHCEVPCSGWAYSTFWRTSFRVQCCGSFPASPGSVWAYSLQTGKILACKSGRPSLLYSSFSSLSLISHPLSVSHSFSVSSLPTFPPPPPLFPAPLESKTLYGEFITTAAIVQPSLVHRRPRPGPRVQCQAHICLAGKTEILIFCPDSAVPSHHHISAPHLPFSFLASLLPQTQPPYRTLVPTFQQDCMPGQWNGTRARREERRDAVFEAGLHFNDIWAPPTTTTTILSILLALLDWSVATLDDRRAAAMELIMNDQRMMSALQGLFTQCAVQ